MSGAPPVVIRDARPHEHDAIAALTWRAYAEIARVMTPEAWAGLEGAVAAALASDAPVTQLVAEHGGRLVGSVRLYPPSADAYAGAAERATWPELRLLAVDPTARGLGVGRALVEACAARARAMGADALGLHTSRSMAAAIGLYERLGFERVPALDFQPPGAELVTAYVLRLP